MFPTGSGKLGKLVAFIADQSVGPLFLVEQIFKICLFTIAQKHHISSQFLSDYILCHCVTT